MRTLPPNASFVFPVTLGLVLIFTNLARTGHFRILCPTIFSEAIHHSYLLKSTAGCVISCAFPMIVDSMLDMWSSTCTKDIVERLVVLLSLIVPNAVLLGFTSEFTAPVVFVAFQLSQAILVAGALYCAIDRLCPNRVSRPLLIGTVCWDVLTGVLNMYSIGSRSGSGLREASLAALVVSLFLIIVVEWKWFLSLRNHVRGQGGLDVYTITTEEILCSMYLLIYLTYIVLVIILTQSLGSTSWESAGPKTLVLVSALQILFCIPVMIIPNRLVRMDIVKTALALLELKRTFVRYVSHEIRSPLNVSLAGLEMVKAEIVDTNASKSLVELVGEIYEANEIAISILSDLLHYESLDAGTFEPEMKEMRLVRMFKGKLSFCMLLAKKKNIVLTIKDYVNCMGQGFFRDPGQNQRLDPSRYVLSIDIPRTLQVLRNLVTNAVKFTPEGGKMIIKMSIVECQSKAQTILTKTTTHHGFWSGKTGKVLPAPNSSIPQLSLVEARQDAGGREEVNHREGSNTNAQNNTEGTCWALRIEVTDSGAGIAPENHGRVFGEFSQFNRNKLQDGGGSGLGLWVCRKIVQMHSGILDFTSEGEGQGSTFYIDLPIACRSASFELLDIQSNRSLSIDSNGKSRWSRNHRKDSKAAKDLKDACKDAVNSLRLAEGVEHSHPDTVDRKRPQRASFLVPTQPLRPQRFLIVDDSAMNRKIMKRMIESEAELLPNSVIIEADDGVTAIEAMKKDLKDGNTLDCVMMDFVMLKMHGPEAASIMRKEIGFKGTIIAVTGNVMPQEYRVFLESGADDVLAKPLTKAKLLRLLTELNVIGRVLGPTDIVASIASTAANTCDSGIGTPLNI